MRCDERVSDSSDDYIVTKGWAILNITAWSPMTSMMMTSHCQDPPKWLSGTPWGAPHLEASLITLLAARTTSSYLAPSKLEVRTKPTVGSTPDPKLKHTTTKPDPVSYPLERVSWSQKRAKALPEFATRRTKK